ncbi:hypothetical protein QQG55_53080 [Brugia pahangi]
MQRWQPFFSETISDNKQKTVVQCYLRQTIEFIPGNEMEMEMKMMNDLIGNAHFQINKMNWEEKVQNFTDNTWECLCDNVTDITNIQEKCINIENKLIKIFKYIKYDIESRLSALKSDSNISYLSSNQYYPFYNKSNNLENTLREKTLENDILSSIYMMQHSLLKIDAFQKRKMGLNKYCSTIRLLIYDRLNKCIAMLDNILAAMQFIIIEIDKQFDSIYSVNRYIALFNELYQQFQHNYQKFFSQQNWIFDE